MRAVPFGPYLLTLVLGSAASAPCGCVPDRPDRGDVHDDADDDDSDDAGWSDDDSADDDAADDDSADPNNSPPEVLDAEAWCDGALTYWTLDALVTDPDGDLDIDFVWAEVWEIYPDKSETFMDTVDLYDDVDGWWSREIETEVGYLNCEFLYTYCFDFQAEDVFGDVSDYFTYCV